MVNWRLGAVLCLFVASGCPGEREGNRDSGGGGGGDTGGDKLDTGSPPADISKTEGGIYQGCFERFDKGGDAFSPTSSSLFSGSTSVAKGWTFMWDGAARGRHKKNQFSYLTSDKKQRIVADGSSMVLYRPFSPGNLPKTGTLQLKHSSKFDTSDSGTPASQGCKDTDAGWVEILMTNDIKGVLRAIVWKNDGSKDGSFDLKKVCPLSDPDKPSSANCYIGVKVGAHQDGKNTDPKFPCATGNFIFQVDVDELCLK